jgi:hypothetical protein
VPTLDAESLRQIGGDHGGVTILADTSTSMDARVGARRAIDILRDVLVMAMQDAPAARIIAFHSVPNELTGLEPHLANLKLPEPCGSTALHLALNLAAKTNPDRVIVISDGMPDDRLAALRAARALPQPVTIDCLFVGSDDDRDALGFMQTLALCGVGKGTVGIRSLRKPEALASELRGLLGGPAR